MERGIDMANQRESVLERMERENTKEKIAAFMVKQQLPYEIKVRHAEIRAREFADECNRRGLNYHVSVGGLDSITLAIFLKKLHIDCPLISCSLLEDKSIQKIHRELGVISLYPAIRNEETGQRWSKPAILQEFGFPVLSKEIANKIETLANPTSKGPLLIYIH